MSLGYAVTLFGGDWSDPTDPITAAPLCGGNWRGRCAAAPFIIRFMCFLFLFLFDVHVLHCCRCPLSASSQAMVTLLGPSVWSSLIFVGPATVVIIIGGINNCKCSLHFFIIVSIACWFFIIPHYWRFINPLVSVMTAACLLRWAYPLERFWCLVMEGSYVSLNCGITI